MEKTNEIPFLPADILLPKDADMHKWSVVACDQYTSQPAYWKQVESIAEGVPSTLHITFPEAYLEEGDPQVRIDTINATMQQYMDSDVFTCLENAYVYIERKVSNGKIRRGLIGKVDLEAYDYNKGATSLIRATEGTVLERIPPRVKIREHAPLELPHIMLLIDDPYHRVIEPLAQQNLKRIYDFDLMQNGGDITGYAVEDSSQISQALASLLEAQHTEHPLLFAVGDGNHSLATAKQCWENAKQSLPAHQLADHPARYALVELTNIHDESLSFEPIHRVLFQCDPDDVISSLLAYNQSAKIGEGDGQQFHFVTATQSGVISMSDAPSKLTVGTLQAFLDDYVAKKGGRIDYIHGEDVVVELAQQPGNIGFLLPAMDKSQLFPAVMADGALPRKTFSMGEAEDKRFYLECRKIK